MPEYMPTTREVRHEYAASFLAEHQQGGREEFDRWLAEHDAQVRAETLRDVRQAIREIPYWYEPHTGASGFDLQHTEDGAASEEGAREAVCDALIRVEREAGE